MHSQLRKSQVSRVLVNFSLKKKKSPNLGFAKFCDVNTTKWLISSSQQDVTELGREST